MTEYMPHEQCHDCQLDHCCWSLGSFLWEDGNTPNNCKQFIPKLKPCLCGSEDIQHSYGQIDGNVKGYTILCRDCGYYVEDCEGKSAVEKWNRRVKE